ncbi:MAG: 50S ribosomal protein L10 [Acidimicrobiales bacterium]
MGARFRSGDGTTHEKREEGGGEMTDPRPEKVAVVDEVKQKLTEADGAMLTEYRGLDVRALADLRRALRDAGGEYKIYKNTLVRRAAQDLGLDIEDLLVGPTAIAFVPSRDDGSAGDVAAVAKALKDFAKTNNALVLKGGVLDEQVLSSDDVRALADLPSRDVLLAQLAGAFQAPMAKFAGLLAAVPRNFAYGLQALIDQGGAPGAPAVAAESESASDADDVTEVAEAAAVDTTDEAVEAESTDEASASDAAVTEASTDAGEDSGDAGESGDASDDTEEA